MSSSQRAKNVSFIDEYLMVELEDGRRLQTPLSWYKELQEGTPEIRNSWKFICKNTGIEWEEIDYQLSIEGMLNAINPSHRENTRRISVVLPSSLLKKIDKSAKNRHISRSKIIEEAITEKM